VVLDLDDVRVPPDVDAAWWRAQIEAHLGRAVTEEAAARDVVLAGWTMLDEVLAAPSASRLEGVAACLLD
jgi:hypothetical protein